MPWVRLEDDFYDHPKMAAAGPLGIAWWVTGLAYSNRNLTDGRIPRPVARRLLDLDGLGWHMWMGELSGGGEDVEPDALIQHLIDAGLWHDSKTHCGADDCPTALPGGYSIHGFFGYQPSAEQVKAERKRSAERQQKWREGKSNRGGNAASNGVTDTVTDTVTDSASATESHTPTNGHVTLAPVPVPVPQEQKTLAATEPPRADVESLCRRLADAIEANGSKRPTITQTWRDEARRLLDLDKRPLAEALRLVAWSQSDTFWRTNVLSMPTFRAKYDQLRLKAGGGPTQIEPRTEPKAEWR